MAQCSQWYAQVRLLRRALWQGQAGRGKARPGGARQGMGAYGAKGRNGLASVRLRRRPPMETDDDIEEAEYVSDLPPDEARYYIDKARRERGQRMQLNDLETRFAEFDQANPLVYRLFKAYARKIQNTGRNKYSAWTIVNVIRWEEDLRTVGDDFKINNDYIALYARKLVEECPDFDGFFMLREMRRA